MLTNSQHTPSFSVTRFRSQVMTLDRRDFEIINEAAHNLATQHFKGKNWDRLIATTFKGLKAEYAAIKFMNYKLGAVTRIPFRVEYKDGRDGGIDFTFQGVNFDVKHAMNGLFSWRNVLRTGSHIIIFASSDSEISGNQVEILGFAPMALLRQQVGKECAQTADCFELMKLFPDHLKGEVVQPRNAGAVMTRLGAIANRITKQIEAGPIGEKE
jgi:hypothetical protein